MLTQHTDTIEVSTKGRQFHDLTPEVATKVKVAKITEGLATLHLQHTSASLVIQENADPGVRRDLERFMARVCPDGDPMFEHDYEGPDDMPAHVRTALTGETTYKIYMLIRPRMQRGPYVRPQSPIVKLDIKSILVA